MDARISITLFRHGMTAANEQSQYIGWSDLHLSKNGRAYTEQVHNQLKENNVQTVFSSDLKRCTETAEILFPHQKVKTMHNLREMHFGEWEEKSYDDLKHIPSYRSWIDSPFDAGPDGGEHFKTFNHRITQAFEDVKRQMAEHSLHDVAIITHGGVIRCLLTMLIKSDNTFFDWQVPYAGGYELQWDDKEFWRGNKCISLQAVPTTENPFG